MYTEYKVITDYSLELLVYTINDEIEKGWQPIGGIGVVPYTKNPDGYGKKEDFDTMMYLQAIAK